MTSVASPLLAAPGALYRNPRMGDLVIRTSDGIEFHVYQAIISAASPLFLDMFTLPQPPSPPAPAGKPSVDVAEDSSVWSTLIMLCYAPRPPVPDDFADLDAARALLDAAVKYEMAVAVEFARMGLLLGKFVEEQPFSVYALGCAYKLPDVARAAARRTLRFPIYFEHTKELDLVPLRVYHRLSEYRRKCGVFSRELVREDGVPQSAEVEKHTTRVQLKTSERSDEQDSTQIPHIYVYKEVPFDLLQPMCRGGTGCARTYGEFSYGPSVELERDSGFGSRRWNSRRVTGQFYSAAMKYMETLYVRLEFLPDANLACSKPLLQPIIDTTCSVCLKTIHQNVSRFSEALRDAIEDIISQVELEIDE
ncbi:hypothetical protein OH77DRAFT_1422043 [Trametes cingulata]|nr:hypothetical protein OH77DRAFT_1422043 [Trametes cingulata]